MKKRIFKTVTAALTAVLAINSFSINSKPASAEEINSIETMETENFDGKLIYEHTNEDGLIERVYLKNTTDSNGTQSATVNFTYELYDSNTRQQIARNEMYTAWAYDGAVPTYPYLAYYTNTPYAINVSNIYYKSSTTIQKKESALYCTEYQATLSYTYYGKTYDWICKLTFRSNGTYYPTNIREERSYS